MSIDNNIIVYNVVHACTCIHNDNYYNVNSAIVVIVNLKSSCIYDMLVFGINV